MLKVCSTQHRRHTFSVGVVLLALMLAACSVPGVNGTTADSKGCMKIGVLLPNTTPSDHWESKDKPQLLQAIPAALAGAKVDYQNAQGSAATQLSQAQQALKGGDCILVVAAQDGDAASAIVQAAKAKNVPVIAYDRLIQNKDLAFSITFDIEKAGELQGNYIVDHHKKGDNVAMIYGSQTDNTTVLLRQGVLKVLQPLFTSGELKKVYDVFTSDPSKGQTEMEKALTQNQNNIQIAYLASDDLASSASTSIKSHNLTGKVLVTGVGATVTGIQNVLIGNQTMTIYDPIAQEAKTTADLVAAISKGNTTTTLTNGQTIKTKGGAEIPSLLLEPIAVDKTNVLPTIIADGFLTKMQVCQNLPAGTGSVC